jgi:tetratricopeptide (TPR) repeat protein
MKKNNFYQAALIIFVLTVGFIACKHKEHQHGKTASFYPLKERKASMAQSEEAKYVQKQFTDLMKIIGTNPNDMKSRITLASLYIQEARVTGDYSYYNKAAMKYIDEVLKKDPSHFEALTFKALILLSQHQFAEGLVIAEKARSIGPHNAFVHGMLVDANVELGDYTKAVEEADKMISIRPDIRSYSRVSYLREIHGDYPGAIEAMKLAVDAGMPGDEATEWARVHLGKLYETTGDSKNAEMHYQIALEKRPNYAYAIAGQGRMATASGDYKKAIDYYMKADSLVNDYSFKEEMAQVYELAGEKEKANAVIKELIHIMDEHGGENEHHGDHHQDNMEHYIDGELAHIYLKAGDYANALEHALTEYKRRPANIEVNETVAWVYYNRGEYEKALPYLEAALKTKSKNPALLCKAGLIYAKTGKKDQAMELLDGVIKANYKIPEPLKQQSLSVLKTL